MDVSELLRNVPLLLVQLSVSKRFRNLKHYLQNLNNFYPGYNIQNYTFQGRILQYYYIESDPYGISLIISLTITQRLYNDVPIRYEELI